MPRGARAFTLPELLVVLGLVAILVAFLLPALVRARAAADQIACASRLRQWSAAVHLYANANGGWLPRRGQGAQPTVVIDRPEDWFNALPPLMRLPPFVDLVAAGRAPRPGTSAVWTCPAALDAGQQYFFCYGMNMRLSTWQTPTPDRITRVGPWSTLVFMADAPGPYCSVLPAAAKYSPLARHRGNRLNIAFLDTHVVSFYGPDVGCNTGDPLRSDVRWVVANSAWAGPGN